MNNAVLQKNPSYAASLNRDEENIEIYRVMPVHRLFEIFDTQEMTLVSPYKWEDPFEDLLMKTVQKCIGNHNSKFMGRSSSTGLCWTINEESDATWRIYSHDKQGVKVKTTIGKLITSLDKDSDTIDENCLIGYVDYLTNDEIISKLECLELLDSPYNVALSLLYKRKEFKHEKEIRLIHADSCYEGLFNISIDPHGLFDEIVFDPRMDERLFEIYHVALTRLGYKKPIKQSQLYNLPEFTVLRDEDGGSNWRFQRIE